MASLVVIVGWLGCQRKHLKLYEALYNSLGFDSSSFVASPSSVVDSTLSLLRQNKIIIPSSDRWPVPPISSSSEKLDTMQDWAWKVLGEIYNSRAEIFIFHVFSNGGCFLWESLCHILFLSKNHKDYNPEIAAVLEDLSAKCKGVVFDSCPCWFGSKQTSKLSQALQYCSKEEKQRVVSIFGERIFTVNNDILNRNVEYFHNLTVCPFDIPQLYLCSKNDDLCDHEYITNLIKNRRSRQKNPVLSKVWDQSIHCAHLREHDKDYEIIIMEFVQQIDVFRQARL